MNGVPRTGVRATVPMPSVKLLVAGLAGLPSSSTSSVSAVTAIVVIDADALTVGLPAEVAVTVDVLDVPSAAVAGAATLTQTSCVAPAARLAVAVIEVVQVESKKLVAKVPPDDVRL